MIYCPKCGTANRDVSRFCSECGEELAIQTQIACPRCGTLNPIQNVLCSECDARLPTSAPSPPDAETIPAIRGLSLPTKNPADEHDEEPAEVAPAEPEDDLPAWLRELGATMSEAGEADDADDLEDQVPDWLRDLRASLPEEPEDGIEPEEEEETQADWLGEPEPTLSETEIMDGPGQSIPEPQAAEPEVPGIEIESEQEPAVPEPQEDEIPGWLSRLVPSATAPGPETEPSPSAQEEIPGWLSRLVPGEAEAEAEAAPVTTPEEGEIPDLVEKLPPTGEETEIVEEPIPDSGATPPPAGEGEIEAEPLDLGSEEDEVAERLAELQALDEETEAGVELPHLEIEEGEIPDWVAALRPTGEEAETKPLDLELEGEELPDRVAELEPPSDELPLAEALDFTDEEKTEPPAPKPAFTLPPEVEAALGPAVPAWLAELQIEAPEAAAAIIEETAVDGELPEWLVRSEIEPDESITPAEIPAWLLALKPTELREEGAEPPSPEAREWSEETGLLAGIPGTLPVEMLIAQPRAIAAVVSPALTIEESPPAQIFSDIVGRPPDATPKEIPRPKVDVLPKTTRWIIYAALILLVALPIIIGEPLLSRTIEPTEATAEMYREIESVVSDAPVLVAFDYDPTSSGEMDLIARALIDHLMQRDARLVIVSLLPAGPITAESILEELAVDRPSYADGYGDKFVNLGYLPGQAAAVRILGLSVETALPRDFYGTPLNDLPAMQELDSAQDFSLIVELAATQDTLRWWIEQAGTPYDVPLGAGASAAVAPFARPYYEAESRQLVGLVGGVPDAATYEALTSGQNSPTNSSAARLDSQLAGQLLLVLVILAGNVAYLTRRGTRRER